MICKKRIGIKGPGNIRGVLGDPVIAANDGRCLEPNLTRSFKKGLFKETDFCVTMRLYSSVCLTPKMKRLFKRANGFQMNALIISVFCGQVLTKWFKENAGVIKTRFLTQHQL